MRYVENDLDNENLYLLFVFYRIDKLDVASLKIRMHQKKVL